MKKSKKSSKAKPKFVLIYGSIGVGKLTVAQELQKITTGFSLIHNHMILNLVEELFPRGEKTSHRSNLIMRIFTIILEEAAQKNRNIILTHPFSYSFVYKNGISDKNFVENMIKIFEKNGGSTYPAHLICDLAENMKRALNKERKIHRKLTDKAKLKKIFDKEDSYTSPNLKNNFKIETTHLPAKEVAQRIKKHFGI